MRRTRSPCCARAASAMVGLTTYDAATEAGADASKFWCMARCDVL